MSGRLDAVRRRAWPTRRAFDERIEVLAHELTELRAAVAELAAQQAVLVEWGADVRTRVRRSQALTARVYETLQRWPELLRAAREEPSYELAYTDPEPLVSIVVSTYHSPDTLCERALASVLAQSYENWEAIVVGDHCTDDTERRVGALGDPRIRFHNLPVRETDPPDPWERWAVKGSVPRSVATGLATGRWIAPMSHDDAWDADHLETLLGAAREHRAEFAYSRMRTVDAEDPNARIVGSVGAFPPSWGQFTSQSSMFHGGLRFLRYDRACALASEPNDWNLARRAWEAGVRFHHVDRETATLYVHDRHGSIADELAAKGLPPSAMGSF